MFNLVLPCRYQPPVAVALTLFVAVLAVRALGMSDLNPVSGVGKLSQVLSPPSQQALQRLTSMHELLAISQRPAAS